MESTTTAINDEAQLPRAAAWWDGLNNAWKQAFNEAILRRSSTEPLGDELLLAVYSSPNHRFAGPTAPFPNMTFELEDMSGLLGLPNVELAIIIHHKLAHIHEAAQFKNLRSIFVHNNQITSLEGLEDLTQLKEIYCNVNQIDSLKPLEKLTNLSTIYCNYNLISNFDGIGEQHVDRLENFYCMPNPNLKESVALRFEQEIGIRCKRA